MGRIEKIIIVAFLVGFIIMSVNYHMLNNSYKRLEENYLELSTRYERLKAERDLLLQNITVMEQSFNATLALYNSWLQGNLSTIPILLEKITYLSTVVSQCANLLSSPQGIDYLEELTQQERNIFLQKALNGVPDIIVPDEYVSKYGIPMAFPVYVSLITYYQQDPVVIKEYWKLPNETLSDLGGDCEDLSLLTYSLLFRAGYNKTYLIQWIGNGVGHVAVLTFISGKWYLIDTAGNWYNGLKMYLSLKISKLNITYDAKLPPLTLRPEIKDWLIRNGYAYIDLTVPPDQKYVNGDDLCYLLTQWISYWVSNGAQPSEYRVVGFNIYYRSPSLVQFANFIENISK